MKNKKIVILILVLVFVSAFYLINRGEEETVVDQELLDFLGLNDETSGIDSPDLYFSELSSVEIPDIDLSEKLNFDLSGINMNVVGDSGKDLLNLSVPEVSINDSIFKSLSFDFNLSNISFPSIPFMPRSGSDSSVTSIEQETVTSPPQLSAETCSMFALAPNCSYVPASGKDLCEQCKAAGF